MTTCGELPGQTGNYSFNGRWMMLVDGSDSGGARVDKGAAGPARIHKRAAAGVTVVVSNRGSPGSADVAAGQLLGPSLVTNHSLAYAP
jgi:hypothetical protein